MSGSNPYFYSDISGTWTLVDGASTDGGVITATSCSPNIFLVLADVNGNPMPYQTAITASTTVSGLTIGTVFPASVNNIGVAGGIDFTMAPTTVNGVYTNGNGVVNGQGITIPITIAAPLATCKSVLNTTTSSFTFQVETTTPKGNAVLHNFTYVYPTN